MLELSTGTRIYKPSVEEWFAKWLDGKKGSRKRRTWERNKGILDTFLDELPKGTTKGFARLAGGG